MLVHFKDQMGRLYALSDLDLSSGGVALLPAGSVQVTDTEADAIKASIAESMRVPYAVQATQARIALLRAGKLEQVEQALAAIPNPMARAEAAIWWRWAMRIERDNPFVLQIGESLGLDLDELFITAGAIQ